MSVHLPATVASLDEASFGNNSDLESVTFHGPAPSGVVDADQPNRTFDTTSNPTLYFPWEYGEDAGVAGGYTTPTWHGYNTVPLNVPYTVSFDLNDHGTAPAEQLVQPNNLVQRPSDPSASGYTFTGWFTDAAATAEYDFDTPVTGDLTLNAGWEAVVPTPPGGSGQGSQPSTGAKELADTGAPGTPLWLVGTIASLMLTADALLVTRRRRAV